SEHLSLLWPMVVTELMTVLSNADKENPNVLLEAIKFIDYATILLPEEFQLFKWIFIEDNSIQQFMNEEQEKSIKFKSHLSQFGTLKLNQCSRPLKYPKSVKLLQQVGEIATILNSNQNYNQYDDKYMNESILNEFSLTTRNSTNVEQSSFNNSTTNTTTKLTEEDLQNWVDPNEYFSKK